MKKTYAGGCHCGAVTFEVALDLSQGTGRCNCSFCARTRSWNAMSSPEDLRLLSGENELADYPFGSRVGHHRFCRRCGTQLFGHGHLPELGGDFVSVRIAALEDLDDNERAALVIQYFNGRDNAWHEAPTETRHL